MNVIGLILLIVSLLLWPLPATATPLCRTINNHQVCILKITRSAKNHWEYRAAVSVDGQKRPMETYNCRTQFRIPKTGAPISFAADEAGTLICSYFKKR